MSLDRPAYVTIDGYVIDCSISETHVFDAEVTDHPVEKGADVTDNVRSKPIVVTINGMVSDSPLTDLATIRANSADGGLLPSDDALARLEKIRDDGEPITITTAIKSYDSMVLQSLTVPRDAKTGHALRFTAVFKQVIIVSNDQAFVPVSDPQNGNKAHRGNKPSASDGHYSLNGRPGEADDTPTSLLGLGVDQFGVKNKITSGTLSKFLGLDN